MRTFMLWLMIVLFVMGFIGFTIAHPLPSIGTMGLLMVVCVVAMAKTQRRMRRDSENFARELGARWLMAVDEGNRWQARKFRILYAVWMRFAFTKQYRKRAREVWTKKPVYVSDLEQAFGIRTRNID